MKILLADSYGMCFGVRDAIALAERLAKGGSLTILGELVHNPIVRARLAAQGIRETTAPTGERVLITAHGLSDRARTELAARNEVADATCPLVRHAHAQLRRLVQAGYFPIVIGQRAHVEVRGLIGDFDDAVVLNEAGEIDRLPVRERYGVISQTTQPIDHARALVTAIRRARPVAEVRFIDTVCKPTKDRQLALHHLIARSDVVVVVGGRHSNNTLQLVATCAAAGRRVVHIEQAAQLEPMCFAQARVVGVTAGTSTLPETVAAVVKRLEIRFEMGLRFFQRYRVLWRGDAAELRQFVLEHDFLWLGQCALLIAAGGATYGLTVGLWRSPLQSGFTAIKFPLLTFLTCAGNALLNGVLAQLIGSGLSFRQTSVAILTSLAVAAGVLLSVSPVALFVLWQTPPLSASNALIGHSVMLLLHVFLIGFAGVVGNLVLFRLLRTWTSQVTAFRTLCSWLVGNFILGSQLAWVLRPFIGAPELAVQFLRPNPWRGNFYEAVWRALAHLLSHRS